MKITLLGQAGFFIELKNGLTLMLDPYLSNSLFEKKGENFRRLVPISEKWRETVPDILAITHEHGDHYDVESVKHILERKSSHVLCTYPVFKHAKACFPGNNYIIMRPSVEWHYKGIGIKAVKAFHEDPESVGYLFSAEGKTIYFSGDTLLSDEIVESIGNREIDLCFVCINGVGNNMNIEDATELVLRIKPKLVVPVHWDMFKHYGADPNLFEKNVNERLDVKILKAYEEIIL